MFHVNIFVRSWLKILQGRRQRSLLILVDWRFCLSAGDFVKAAALEIGDHPRDRQI
jgi:hypothetical protein